MKPLQPKLTAALLHEYARCEDAFTYFEFSYLTWRKDADQRRASLRCYNAYSYFILHLYEFWVGCIERDRRSSKPTKILQRDQILDCELEKIKRFTAGPDAWKRGLDGEFSGESCVIGFGREFRKARNIAISHVGDQRITFSLAEFFSNHHQSILILYEYPRWLWSMSCKDFPDIENVTDFARALDLAIGIN